MIDRFVKLESCNKFVLKSFCSPMLCTSYLSFIYFKRSNYTLLDVAEDGTNVADSVLIILHFAFQSTERVCKNYTQTTGSHVPNRGI